MADNVIPLGGITKLDLPVERVLDGAKGKGLDGVILLGWDGEEQFYFSSTYADGGTVLWLLEKAKKELMEIADVG